MLFALFFSVFFYTGCRMALEHMVTREDRLAPRDPETGLMIGAEEKWLGPADSKRAALFVHGYVGGGNIFAGFPEWMAEQGWRVRVMRLPAHGTSPRDMETVTGAQLLNAVKHELAELKRDYPTVAVVSHSMGGSLATLAVAEEGADYLVLGAPYYGVTYKWYYILPVERWNRILAPVAPYVYKGKAFMQISRKDAKDQIFSYAWISTKSGAMLADLAKRANDPATLAKVTCSTLMLHAPEDRAASYDMAKKAFVELGSKEKKFVDLPNSNHIIYWDNDAELMKKEMTEFLNRSETKAGIDPSLPVTAR